MDTAPILRLLAPHMFDKLRKRLWHLRHDNALSPEEAALPAPREYKIALPDGYPAKSVSLKISMPPLPPRPLARFTDHVVDPATGKPGRTLLATVPGGFTISDDLGETWRRVKVQGHAEHRFIHVRALGEGEYLVQVQTEDDPKKTRPLDLLVVNERGKILAEHAARGPRWHGCRAVDQANGTLMYAEYPSGESQRENIGSRVWRSRDRGRSWQMVFERGANQIRHFHFLQAHPRHAGEWWLASGDQPHESRIWVSKDDGGSWNDVTAGGHDVRIDGHDYPRSIFRLTDLAWDGDDIVWGTDDVLWIAHEDLHGGHLFRANTLSAPLKPQELGKSRWHIRNLVDVGDFYIVLTQSSNQPEATEDDRKPGVLLLAKHPPANGPALVHLFDVEAFTDKADAGSGFTFSKASRAAVDGTFFTFRAPFHVFPHGHQILRWDIHFS